MKKILTIYLTLALTPLFSQAQWEVVEPKVEAQKRHESSMVECDGKFYSLGGRGKKPIEAYDPKTNAWTILADPPMEFHHFQALAFKHEIYVIGAFTGGYPHEKPIAQFLIFNPKTNSWREGTKIPEERLRGSVGVFSKGDNIYIVAGIKDGHWDGHVAWFDEYNTKTGKWSILPDAPRARDHFQAAYDAGKVYIAGGRRSHAAIGKVLELTIGEVDVFDFKTNQWSTLENLLPTTRAGTSSLIVNKQLIIMNGESSRQVPAHNEVEALDLKTGTWKSLDKMKQGRHGTGVVKYKKHLYVVAGSANRGGGPELSEMERLAL